MLVRRVSWKEKSLLKHRADKAIEVRNSFSPLMKVFSDKRLVSRKTKRFISSFNKLLKPMLSFHRIEGCVCCAWTMFSTIFNLK